MKKRMRKQTAILLAAFLAFTMGACSSAEDGLKDSKKETESAKEKETEAKQGGTGQ